MQIKLNSVTPINKVISTTQPKPLNIGNVTPVNKIVGNTQVQPVQLKQTQVKPVQPISNIQPITTVQNISIQNTPVNSEKVTNEHIIKNNTENKILFEKNEGVLLEDEFNVSDLKSWKENQQNFIDRINKVKGNVIFCDVPTDETKSAEMLIKEGKLLGTRKMGAYILSYDVLEDTINKIFIDDIISVDVNSYYDDVASANPKYLGSYYNVYHKGQRVFDKISKKTYEFLKSKGLIPAENIITIDANTRIRFFGLELKDITIEKYKHELAIKLKTANRFEGFSLNSDLEEFRARL